MNNGNDVRKRESKPGESPAARERAMERVIGAGSMLVTFESRAYSDVVMFGDVAMALLRMMGRRDAVPGAMYPDDIPLALHSLRDALDALPDESQSPTSEKEHEEQRPVDLRDRAFPLIDLLNAAHRERAHVMWHER